MPTRIVCISSGDFPGFLTSTMATISVRLRRVLCAAFILASLYVSGFSFLDFFVTILGLFFELLRQLRRWIFPAHDPIEFSGWAGSSLTNLNIGGYNKSNINPESTLRVKISDTENNALTVSVHAIGLRGQTEAIWLPSSNVQTLQSRIDSLTPKIWLPANACTMLEEVFGLIWNYTLEF